jgi:hypothetical protein
MANRFKLKRSSTALVVPSPGTGANQIDVGELALNLADEKLYFVNSSGVVVHLLSTNKTPAGGGGGGATWVKTTINIPYSTINFYQATITVPACTVSSIVPCQLVGGNENAETEAEDMKDWKIMSIPRNGSITFNISAVGCFGGPVDVIYQVQ